METWKQDTLPTCPVLGTRCDFPALCINFHSCSMCAETTIAQFSFPIKEIPHALYSVKFTFEDFSSGNIRIDHRKNTVPMFLQLFKLIPRTNTKSWIFYSLPPPPVLQSCSTCILCCTRVLYRRFVLYSCTPLHLCTVLYPCAVLGPISVLGSIFFRQINIFLFNDHLTFFAKNVVI